MFTVAIVASDPSDKASAAEFASSSLNAAVVFRDSVAAALEHSPLFDCIPSSFICPALRCSVS